MTASLAAKGFINRYGVESWYQLGSGSTVGNQRIVLLPFGGKNPSCHFRVRVTATAGPSATLPPAFRSISLFNTSAGMPPAPPPAPPAPANCLTGTWTSTAQPTALIRVVETGTAVTTAVDETVVLLHLLLPLVSFSIGMERERQQNDSIANG